MMPDFGGILCLMGFVAFLLLVIVLTGLKLSGVLLISWGWIVILAIIAIIFLILAGNNVGY